MAAVTGPSQGQRITLGLPPLSQREVPEMPPANVSLVGMGHPRVSV